VTLRDGTVADKALLKDVLKLLLSLYSKEMETEARKELARGDSKGVKNFILIMDGLQKGAGAGPITSRTGPVHAHGPRQYGLPTRPRG